MILVSGFFGFNFSFEFLRDFLDFVFYLIVEALDWTIFKIKVIVD